MRTVPIPEERREVQLRRVRPGHRRIQLPAHGAALMIEVVSPGLHSLVQDLGRDGYYAIGMPPSGALDQYSHSVANLLVGNDISAATLEVTFLGPEMLFHDSTTVAVTGATLPVWLDGEPVEQWAPLAVSAGQTLKFGMMTAGCRVYIAVTGGIDTVPFLGSRSTYA